MLLDKFKHLDLLKKLREYKNLDPKNDAKTLDTLNWKYSHQMKDEYWVNALEALKGKEGKEQEIEVTSVLEEEEPEE